MTLIKARHMVARGTTRSAIWLFLGVLALLTLFPFYWAVKTSFETEEHAIAIPPRLLPSPVRLLNYPEAWHLFPFARFHLNSLIFAVLGTVGSIAVCACAGYALAKYAFPGQRAVLLIIVATMMIPFWVNLVPVYVLLANLGWLDTYHGLIIPRLARPFGIFLMRQYIITVPSDYIDAGRIDGTSEFRIFSQIIMPQCTPVLATLLIFFFVDDWNTFLWPLLVTNRTVMRTVTVGLALLGGSTYRTAYVLQMAVAVIGVLPSVLVFLAFSRHITQGITLSGLKG